MRANAHELYGRLICAIAQSIRLQACTTTWHTQLHDLRDCTIRTAMQSARLRDMHDCMAYATARPSRLYDLHDCAICMSAWPARLCDFSDCKSTRLRQFSRPPTFAATPRLRCIGICRTPVVDWIGFQRLIPDPVHDNATTANVPNTHPAGKGGIRGSRTPLTSCAAGHITNSTAIHGPNPISTANLRISPRVVVAAANSHRPHPVGNGGILRFFDYRRPVAQLGTHRSQCSPRPESDIGVRFPNQPTETGGPAAGANRANPETAESRGSQTMTSQPPNATTAPKPDQIQSRTRIPEPVQDGGTSDRQSTPVSSRKRLNTNAFGIRSIGNTADSAATLGSNPISVFDFRINPRKQAVRQTDTIRTHPRTAESRGSRNQDQPPYRSPQHPTRTKSNLEVQSPNWSTGSGHCGRRPQLRPHENSGIPRLFDYSRPAAQPGTH